MEKEVDNHVKDMPETVDAVQKTFMRENRERFLLTLLGTTIVPSDEAEQLEWSRQRVEENKALPTEEEMEFLNRLIKARKITMPDGQP